MGIEASGHAHAGRRGDRGRERGVGRECGVDRDGVGVEVEQATNPGDERRQVGEGREPGLDVDRRRGVVAVRREADECRTAGKPECSPVRVGSRDLDAGECAGREPGEDACRVERGSRGQAKAHDACSGARAVGGDRLARRPPFAKAGCGPQLERTALVDLADRVVELADAAEARCERDIRHAQRRGGEERPSRLCPVRAGEGQRTGAELGGEHPGEVARRVTEAGCETRHALAFDHAVGDEAHRPCRKIVAQIPLGRAGHGVGQAPLARPQARLMRRGRREVEAHVRRLRGDRGAARSAVDAGGVHAGDELAVEAGIAGQHRAIALGELGVVERIGVERIGVERVGVERVGGPSKGVLRLRHGSSLARATDIDWRNSDIAASPVHPCRPMRPYRGG